jgi:mannose-1-phosphate guanylyltransferase
MLHAVVMAGGSGTRFWPMSRQNRPKHLLALAGTQSLIQQTVGRVAPLVPPERTWIVTGADHADAVRQQLPGLPAESMIVEPCRRDTAPCIGLAAAVIRRRDPKATMVVLPADHVIEPADRLRASIELAAELIAADASRLVVFGIRPDRPATGYGYIHRGAAVASHGGSPVYAVGGFREKPPLDLAEAFLKTGQYYWNSGIFVWAAATILEELGASRPAMQRALTRIAAAWDAPDRQAVLSEQYAAIERVSIDYAVMEGTQKALVVEADYRWDDVGSWQALERLRGTDDDGNTIVGNHCGLDTHGCIVVSESGQLVATLGVDHLVVVQAGNVTLVADKRDEESVKRLVALARQRGFEPFL